MVPSWTEALIACGVNVVGRTRFCIHPKEFVKTIPAVGGTKDVAWERARGLKPDLVVLDREENPRIMAEECPFEYFATHVTSAGEVARDLGGLAKRLENARLAQLASRWRQVAGAKAPSRALNEIPGVVEWIRKPGPTVNEFVYVIWKDPWMAVSRSTFIGSVLERCGLRGIQRDFEEPYPKLDLAALDPTKTMLLLSTEPYPFHKQKARLEELPFAMAVVDGEAYSWFGLRSLLFLEQQT